MTASTNWPPALVAAIHAELAGNTRLDLLSWANRVLRESLNKDELAKARLVLAIEGGAA